MEATDRLIDADPLDKIFDEIDTAVMLLLQKWRLRIPDGYSYSEIASFTLYQEETDPSVLHDVLDDLYLSAHANVSTFYSD